MLIVAYVLVVSRLWFRLIHQRQSLTLSDFFILVAYLELLGLMVMIGKEYELGVIQENVPMSSQILKVSISVPPVRKRTFPMLTM